MSSLTFKEQNQIRVLPSSFRSYASMGHIWKCYLTGRFGKGSCTKLMLVSRLKTFSHFFSTEHHNFYSNDSVLLSAFHFLLLTMLSRVQWLGGGEIRTRIPGVCLGPGLVLAVSMFYLTSAIVCKMGEWYTLHSVGVRKGKHIYCYYDH